MHWGFYEMCDLRRRVQAVNTKVKLVSAGVTGFRLSTYPLDRSNN